MKSVQTGLHAQLEGVINYCNAQYGHSLPWMLHNYHYHGRSTAVHYICGNMVEMTHHG